jgi:hypothetical protein
MVVAMPPLTKKLSARPATQRVLRIYLFILMSLLMVGGVTFTLATFHKVFYRFGWDDDEGAVWWEAVHVTNLHELYHPIQQYPYFVVPYPPVYHAVTWLAAKGTGNFLIAGRLVCVFSALGISLLLGLIVLHATPQRIPVRIRGSGALIASLLCFRLDSLNIYIPEMGVDLLALFFTFLGVYLFLRFSRNAKALYGAFACFVVAIFTKQTMLAAPLACLAASMLIRPAQGIRYLLFCVALGSAGLGYLVWATSGEVLRHLFFYNAVEPYILSRLILGMQANLISMTPIAAVACLSLFSLIDPTLGKKHVSYLQWLRKKIQSSPNRLAILVLGSELAIAFLISLTYIKDGSGVHYFLEWNFVCCPLAGLFLVRALNPNRALSTYRLGGAAALILIFLAALTGFPDSLLRMKNMYHPGASLRQAQNAAYSSNVAELQIIEQTPGPVLSDNLVLLMQAHKEISIEPGIQNFLGKAGIWDDSGLTNMIRTHQFGVIIIRDLDGGFWTNGIVRAVKDSYVPIEHIGGDGIGETEDTVYRPSQSGQ